MQQAMGKNILGSSFIYCFVLDGILQESRSDASINVLDEIE